MSGQPEISVVVPVYDEEANLPLLQREIATAMEGCGRSYECVYVDDGSRDRSLEVLLELRRADPRIRVVEFARNAGQTAALAAGFDHARGRVVVTLDADLQNDPADIPALVAKLEEGFDIVTGWRRKRHDGFVLRKLPSKIANRLIALVTGVSIHDTGCTLKAFRAELVRNLPRWSSTTGRASMDAASTASAARRACCSTCWRSAC
jgi:glycosyltransferase involved in cell wall biosynthesis